MEILTDHELIGKRFITSAGSIFRIDAVMPEIKDSLAKREELYKITFETGFKDVIGKSYLGTLQLAPLAFVGVPKQEGCGLAVTPPEIVNKVMKAIPKIFVVVEECYCDCCDPYDKPQVSVIKAFIEESAAKAYLEKEDNSCYRIESTELLIGG